jgi:hypothetical protein
LGDTLRHRQHGYRISLLLFFQNKESRPKNIYISPHILLKELLYFFLYNDLLWPRN